MKFPVTWGKLLLTKGGGGIFNKMKTSSFILGEKSRGSDAVQNQWMIRSAVFVLETIKPKCFWGENAPGLFTSGIHLIHQYIQYIQ